MNLYIHMMSGFYSEKNKIDEKLNKNLTSQYIKLNVGGNLFYTTLDTLTKKDTMLRAMFSGRLNVLADNEGWILIDRSGKHFDKILNFLRDSSINLPKNHDELNEILIEAQFYSIQELIDMCNGELNTLEQELEPICRIPLITSRKEEQILLNKTNKPVVKLLINRHNNKYSYTMSSDDNLLKNIELFDRLSLRFSHRILFIKDILGSNEICCWSFFGGNQKVAEVCCTSIVYATEKKQTKVDFPEARIYEDTLNILLYEKNKNGDFNDIYLAPLKDMSIFDNQARHSQTNNTSDDEETKDLEKVRRLRCN